LNAPYLDVPIVYGILNYQDSIQYVKIYKGYQTQKEGNVFIDAQNPDSIYYYNSIKVVLQEYEGENRTSRPDIPLYITNDFPRDSGIFYYKAEKIIYYTTEQLDNNKIYCIKITNLINGNEVKGKTYMIGDFRITNRSSVINMLNESSAISFSIAPNAADYEIHVNFLYFEVDINSNKVVKIGKIVKNICPKVGGDIKKSNFTGDLYKDFTVTFYDDIASQLKPNSNVVRYLGRPDLRGVCIEVEAWAADTNMVNFLLSNKPTSSFVQVNNIYTNLTASEGEAFGFLASRTKCPIRYFSTTKDSQDSLIAGSKTYKLSFRPWTEYIP